MQYTFTSLRPKSIAKPESFTCVPQQQRSNVQARARTVDIKEFKQ